MKIIGLIGVVLFLMYLIYSVLRNIGVNELQMSIFILPIIIIVGALAVYFVDKCD